MRLELALHTVVRERIIPLFNAKKLLQRGVRKNHTPVRRVLEFVFLDVGADCLGHIDAGLEFTIAPNKLGHLIGDWNLLQKPRVDVSALFWLFTHNTGRLGLQTLDRLDDVLEELATLALGGAQVLNLSVKILDKLVKMMGNRLARSLQTRDHLAIIDFDGLDGFDCLDCLDGFGLDGFGLDGFGLDRGSFGLDSLSLDSLGLDSLGLASCGGLSLTVGSSV